MDLRSLPDCLCASKDVDEVYVLAANTRWGDDQSGASATALGNDSVINSQSIEAARSPISRQKHQALYEQMRRDPAHKHETDEQVQHRDEYFLRWQSRHWPKLIDRGVLLLVLLLFAPHFAHCQVDLIQMQQGGTRIGTAVGAPQFNFDDCSVSKSGQTWTITCAGTGSNATTQFQSNNVKAGVPTSGQGYSWNTTNSDVRLQSKPCIDWRDQGITTSRDQSANITNAWNAMNANSCAWMLPIGTILVANSVSPTSNVNNNQGAGYLVEGVGGTGQALSATNFRWTGGAAPMFTLDRQRDSIIGKFNIDLQSVSGATGIQVTQLNSTSGQISSHNLYHDITVNGLGTNGTGFVIGDVAGDSAQNNEAHTLWRVSAGNSVGSYQTGSVCLDLGNSSNERGLGVYEPETISCGTGIKAGAGSWHIIGGTTGYHNLLTAISGNASAGFIGFVHDEGSHQELTVNGTTQSLVLMGNKYDLNAPDLTKYLWDFSGSSSYTPIVSIGNVFERNANVTKMVNVGTGTETWVSIGDSMPNGTEANLPDLVYTNGAGIMIGTGNRYSAPSGIAVLTQTGGGSPAGDGPDITGLFLGTTTFDLSTSNFYDSPISTIAGAWIDSGSQAHIVPYKTRVILGGASNTASATLKLLPPVDPVLGTRFGGTLNFDYQTNGNNFMVNRLETKPVTFATLPACSSSIEGMHAAVTDSTTNTWGATITGSGSNHVGAYCDGTSWTVYAK